MACTSGIIKSPSTQGTVVPSLLAVWQVCDEDGPPLSLDQQLLWSLKSCFVHTVSASNTIGCIQAAFIFVMIIYAALQLALLCVEHGKDLYECRWERSSSNYSIWISCICCHRVCRGIRFRNNHCHWDIVFYLDENNSQKQNFIASWIEEKATDQIQ